MIVHYQEEIRLTHEAVAARRTLSRDIAPRTKGIHLSAITKRIGVALKKMSSDDDPGFPFERMTDTFMPMMIALGIFWEESRASMFPESDMLWQPGELMRDNIYGTPDGLIFAGSSNPCVDTSKYDHLNLNDRPRSWECKRTTKKLCQIEDHWMYLRQGMGYAAMGAPRLVQYDILYALGNYNRPYQPCAVSALVEFSEIEVEMWWNLILNNKGGVKSE